MFNVRVSCTLWCQVPETYKPKTYESTDFDKASSHVLALYDARFTAPEHHCKHCKNCWNIPNVPIIIQINVMNK